ncbi:lytic transglycosylase domain-containing protein [Sporosarcina saromensis]|uniref:Lytic transglycosylase domain-containing protein n=1 Tax=Sporosarcina saromensis TaxID=359365 RepID=A0ABU4GCX9_9BACL|nr:lytic transglycosylase domain-containing protein [Sporosarcina saromensis]MDW0114822.1 lytic transglycosylase domain-containing protein [Sporosarcina saromensis]
MKKRKQKKISNKTKLFMIILLVPIAVTTFTLSAIIWTSIQHPELIKKSASTLLEYQDRHTATTIPEEYISIYKDAAEKYNIPWTLLAAHHRIETRFSTMDPLLSPAGAEGHMQFMPCTFVGWSYPGCSGLGKGDIPEKDKTDPAIIKQHGGYGVDANGDGIADPYDIEDAIFSAANYLSKSGAADGDIEKAIFHYNHSDKYVEDVLWFFNEFESQRLANE